ncbi:MAG: DinB family protein [Candidatus Eisenbacteria bacterium]|nr:DinB family protein [Candidatus Eisenbacteria bacterium]
MTPDGFRDALLAGLAARLGALPARTMNVVAGLSAARLEAAPPHGGWSIAQVLEHLCRGSDAYFGAISASIAAARRRGRPPRAHRRSLFGGLLLGAISESNPRRLPTTPRMRPLTVRAGVIEAFLDSLTKLEGLMHVADGADLRERLWSPLAPLPLNLGDAFEILIAHAERHLGQAERARRATGG